jgi:N-carbamoyl-L-amino-acid hydrolase
MHMQIDSIAAAKLQINADRLSADFEELAAIGGTPEKGVNRLALSPEDLRARAWFADKLDAAGLIVRDDDAANLSGVLPAPDPEAKTLLIGSHLDSVPNGGRYDGAIGVLAGLEILRTIKEAGLVLPFHLEVIDFTDDEGCWKSLFGARAFAGMFTQRDILDIIANNGSFVAALRRAGVIDPRAVLSARRDPAQLVGYLELHIEQGQRLEREGLQIGVVTGIVGRKRCDVIFYGQAGHSGTTDMYKRRDALRGAAQFIVRAHDLVRERFGDGIFNCGDIVVKPGVFNVIPAEARLVVEIRHVDEQLMAEMEREIVGIAKQCAAASGLEREPTFTVVTHMPAAKMNERLVRVFEDSCQRLGVSHKRLVSYSGHASQILGQIMPCGMIFIPSIGGISHHPSEFSRWEDVVTGVNVLLSATLALGGHGVSQQLQVMGHE